MLIAKFHAIRFLADLLEVPPQELNSIYREASGVDLPAAKDLSDPDYWEQIEQRASHRQQEQSNRQSQRNYSRDDSNRDGSPYSESRPDPKIVEALATLGLTPGATQEEIKTAYRRLAAVHHPDRFTSLGQSAVDASTKTFQRVNLAYDCLMGITA